MKVKKMELPSGWYPKKKDQCRLSIENYLKSFPDKSMKGEWIGGIVPHAGWFFSGSLACQTLYHLSQSVEPDVVVIFGGHLSANHNPVYYDYDELETPFGALKQNKVFLNHILKEIEENLSLDYAVDNTIEIQLPFVKYFFPKSEVLAFRSPPSPLAIHLGEVIAAKGKELGLNLAFIASTDLTHYGPNYSFTPKGIGEQALKWVKEENDFNLIQHFKNMEGELAINNSLSTHSACSAGAAASCISASKVLGHSKQGKLVDYYTSYDVRKDSSFVGYLGMLF